MSPTTLVLVVAGSCFPRVSGDEPPPAEGAIRAEEFSPRERG